MEGFEETFENALIEDHTSEENSSHYYCTSELRYHIEGEWA